MLSTDLLRYFVGVAESKSFRGAARRLNVSQPSLSRAVRSIETRLGTELLRRTTRTVELTEAGKAFLSGSRQILAKIDETEEATRLAAAGKLGVLRIGYIDEAFQGPLTQFVRSFCRAFPSVAVELIPAPTHEQVLALQRGTIDIGFLFGPVGGEMLKSRRVREECYVGVFRHDDELAKKNSVTLREFSSRPLVLGDHRIWTRFRAQLDEVFLNAGITPNVIFECAGTVGIFGIVGTGLACTISAESSAAFFCHGTQVARPISDIDVRLFTDAVWHRDNQNPCLMKFLEIMEQGAETGATETEPALP
jgi:DNA-binding transcriptional LysR family regulator